MDVPKLDNTPNPGIKLVSDELQFIPNPNQLIELEDPVKLNTFVTPFKNDYFVYWGSVRTNACKHVLLWILCRQPYAVHEDQLQLFRSLFTSGHQPIMNNARYTHSEGYEVFHVNPSEFTESVLFTKLCNNVCRQVLSPEKIKERQHLKRYSFKNSSESSAEEIGDVHKEKIISSKMKSEKSDASNESWKPSNVSTTILSDPEKNKLLHLDFKETDKNPSDITAEVKTSRKPKRQSHYQQFFSNKSDRSKRKLSKSNKERDGGSYEDTVMNANLDKENSITKLNNLTKTVINNIGNKAQNTKDKSMLKCFTQQYINARTKFKNDVFPTNSENAEDEKMDINSLKYINMQKTKINSDKIKVDKNSEIESPLANNIKEKEVKFNSTLNIHMNDHCFNESGENSKQEEDVLIPHSGDSKIEQTIKTEKIVQDIGINTITLDELMYSMNNQPKTKSVEKVKLQMSSKASGDESNSSCSSNKNSSFREKCNYMNYNDLKSKPEFSYSWSGSPKQKNRGKSEIVEPDIKTNTTKCKKSKQLSHSISESSRYSDCSNNSCGKSSNTNDKSTKDSQYNKKIKENTQSKNKTEYTLNHKRISDEIANQTRKQVSKRTTNLQTSLIISKKSKSSLSCKGERVIIRPETKTVQISVKSQPSSPTKNFREANGSKHLTIKTRIPSIITRSKSNLSYRSYTKSRVLANRPLTPNPEVSSKLSLTDNSLAKNCQIKEATKASKLSEVREQRPPQPTRQNYRVNNANKDPIKKKYQFDKPIFGVSAIQNTKCGNLKTNYTYTQIQMSSKSSANQGSKCSKKTTNEVIRDQSPVQKKTSITKFPDEKQTIIAHEDKSDEQESLKGSTVYSEGKSESTIVHNSSEQKDSEALLNTDEYCNPLRKLAMCKDSIEVLNAHKKLAQKKDQASDEMNTGNNEKIKLNSLYKTKVQPKMRYKSQQNNGDACSYSKSTSSSKKNTVEDTITDCEEWKTPSDSNLPLTEQSYNNVDITDCDNMSNSTDKIDTTINSECIAIKPTVTRTKVFNKIPIKIQKSTPVHTWRY